MGDSAPNINYLWAGLMIEELVRNGISTFCISPGSRNAPLTMAAASNERAEKIVHFDERGTVFYALGRAKATGVPVAFICTSGSAVANAMPAVVEASMSHVPLILLTADRPPELLDTGANQTIEQDRLFGGYLRWYHGMPCPDSRIPPETVLTAMDQAVYRATRSPAGPVHVNCMFREPLAPVADDWETRTDTSQIDIWTRGKTPYTQYIRGDPQSGGENCDEVLDLLGGTKRGLLVVGQLGSREEVGAARALARTLGWATLPDAASGLRFGGFDAPVVHYYDQLLLSPQGGVLEEAETVLHVGGALTSKRLLASLESSPPGTYVRVAGHPLRHDPVHRVTHRLEADLPWFAQALRDRSKNEPDSDWVEGLCAASARVDECVKSSVHSGDALNEIGVLREIIERSPADGTLFLGNSMPIRNADMYGPPGGKGVFVAANRGASGIDGTVATAAGHAAGTGRPVTAVLGDLATLHDLNSLALLSSTPAPVVLVVINNDGGGIFSFLPIAAYPEHFERYFGTPHGLSFGPFAAAFGLESTRPGGMAALVEAYARAIRGGTSCVIEVVTDRRENAALHKGLQERIRSALAG